VNPKAIVLLALFLTSAACNGTPTTSSVTSPTPQTPTRTVISAFAGTWRSTAASGPCTSTAWTITPTADTTAAITYTATCGNIPVSGSATATLSGTTMNWTTSGSGGGCTFALNGTAVPAGSTDLALTYTGTVCNAPVSGTDTLRR
jgi:hypothetical protein